MPEDAQPTIDGRPAACETPWWRLLRALREAAGVTQDGWAAQLGIGRRTVQRWETGAAVPDEVAEKALLEICAEKRLFRTYDSGPLGGLTVTAEWVRDLLAAARSGTAAASVAGRSGRPIEEARAPTNLPVPLTSFIGREREVAEVIRLVSQTRLVTLIGPGGVGKTRVALRAATELRGCFADGAHFVPLAPIRDPALVASATARVLGVREGPGRPLVETLREFLADKELLLVLDNFEHVLEAGPLVTDLLAACPKLRVLTTSRAALRLYGEQELAVPPLNLPERMQAPERLSQYAAVRLFIERAQAIQPNFAVDNVTAPAVAEICHRLDGLPLAIELAAARVRLLPPEALLARLERRLPLLTGGARDLPERHRTLRATIDWSYGLLNDREQQLFRWLSVFFGGWTLEAAEAVCGPCAGQDMTVLDGMSSLLDKSLLWQGPSSAGTARIAMLETVREYGLERLEASGELAEVRRRHATYFLAQVEAAELKLRSAEQRECAAQLEADHSNLRSALAWSQDEGGDPEVGLRLGGVLWLFWFINSHFSEGRSWLERVLAASDPATSARAKSLYGASLLAWMQGDYGQAAALGDQAVDVARRVDDDQSTGMSLYVLGQLAFHQGDHQRASMFLNEALVLLRQTDDRWGVAWSLCQLGCVARVRGDLDRAESLFADGLERFEELGDAHGAAFARHYLGVQAETRGDYDRATRLLEGSIASRHPGDDLVLVWSLYGQGRIAWRRGDYQRAATVLRDCLGRFRQLGDKRGIVRSLAHLAYVVRACGDALLAAHLLGASEALRETVGLARSGSDRTDFEHQLAALKTELNEDLFAAAWGEGREAPLEETLAVALEERLRA